IAEASAVPTTHPDGDRHLPADHAALAGLRILVVDDNPINRLTIRALLSANAPVISEAENGAVALSMLAEQGCDLVLLDGHMPVMDGMETIQRIRAADQPWRDCPVIALTADAMSGDRERFLNAGMDGYVSKPIDRHALIAEILTVLHQKRSV
ncbi:MAG: response regulator, partial [Myxococcota bacterium]